MCRGQHAERQGGAAQKGFGQMRAAARIGGGLQQSFHGRGEAGIGP